MSRAEVSESAGDDPGFASSDGFQDAIAFDHSVPPVLNEQAALALARIIRSYVELHLDRSDNIKQPRGPTTEDTAA